MFWEHAHLGEPLQNGCSRFHAGTVSSLLAVSLHLLQSPWQVPAIVPLQQTQTNG